MAFNLQIVGFQCLSLIKNATWFPYKSGHLKFDAVGGRVVNKNTFQINFSSSIAEYIPYLEEGTGPHNIPKAFGRPLPFGTYGRFNGKFHPGSTKHKGFIKDKSVNAIVQYIAGRYKGEVEIL